MRGNSAMASSSGRSRVVPVRRSKRHSQNVGARRSEAMVGTAPSGVVLVGERLVDAAADEHDLVALLPRVDRVVHEHGLGVEPPDVGVGAEAGDDPEAGGLVGEEAEADPAGGQRFRVPHHATCP